VTNQDVLNRAADIIEGVEIVSAAPITNIYHAIRAAWALLYDEAPGEGLPSSWSVRQGLKARLGVDSLFEWELGRPQSEVIAVLRGAEPVSYPAIEAYLDQGTDEAVVACEGRWRVMQASEVVA
jgi:hypothetical protein